jgi:hypothetical protein
MSLPMEQIVRAYVRLRNRGALEELRSHRQKLMADLDRARSLNFDTTLPLQNVTGDLAAIDAGFEQLDASMRDERG